MKPIFTVSAAVLLAAISALPAVAATAPTKAAPVAAMAAAPVAAKPAAVKAAPVKAAAAAPKVVTFKTIDTNHDGKVSQAELKVVFPTLTKAEFTTADADKSGALSVAEVAAFFKAHAAKK
jgi:hypothetical protein